MNSETPSHQPRPRSIREEDDLAGGEVLDRQNEIASNFFLRQVAYLSLLRWFASLVAVGTLALLCCSLFETLKAFNHQLVKATPNVTEIIAPKVEGAQADAKSSANKSIETAPSASTPPATGKQPVAAKISGTQPKVTEPVSVTASVKVDISSIANSVVAIISILVVAIGVIVISLLRMTFSLAPEQLGNTKERTAPALLSGIPTPGIEAFKIVGEALGDFIKSLKK